MLVLKKAGPYVQDETPLPDFTYASADDANLVRVRQAAESQDHRQGQKNRKIPSHETFSFRI